MRHQPRGLPHPAKNWEIQYHRRLVTRYLPLASRFLLHNGDPLYGLPPAPGGPSFAPMMRLTNVVIDPAGNIWALNNWKPDFDIDLCCNPGGDGVVIFVGLAAPPISQAH